MNRALLALQRAPRALRALLCLVTLVLGAALHTVHHWQDPHCGEARGAEHFCGACGNLHGASLAAANAPPPTPVFAAWSGVLACERDTPLAAASADASPRAPPAA